MRTIYQNIFTASLKVWQKCNKWYRSKVTYHIIISCYTKQLIVALSTPRRPPARHNPSLADALTDDSGDAYRRLAGGLVSTGVWSLARQSSHLSTHPSPVFWWMHTIHPPVIDSAVVGFLLCPEAATLSLFLPSSPCGQWFIRYHLLLVSSSLRSSITFHPVGLRDVLFPTAVCPCFQFDSGHDKFHFALEMFYMKKSSFNTFCTVILIEFNLLLKNP